MDHHSIFEISYHVGDVEKFIDVVIMDKRRRAKSQAGATDSKTASAAPGLVCPRYEMDGREPSDDTARCRGQHFRQG